MKMFEDCRNDQLTTKREGRSMDTANLFQLHKYVAIVEYWYYMYTQVDNADVSRKFPEQRGCEFSYRYTALITLNRIPDMCLQPLLPIKTRNK